MNRSARNKGGFTLIEVLLAMGILALGMSAVLGLFTFGAALTQAASVQSRGSLAMEAITNDLPRQLFPLDERGIPSLPTEPLRDRTVPGLAGVKYHAVAKPVLEGPLAEDGGPLEFDVEVEIFFTNQGVRRARTFHTRILRELSFAERMERRGGLPSSGPQ